MEAVQGIAANGILDAALATSNILKPPEAAPKTSAKRFSKLKPFKRETFDYEKYSEEVAAGLVSRKSRKD
jgi:hypothetical protein